MIRLAISVEGQTEEGFVKEVLANHLCPLGVYPFAIRIHRARSASGCNVGGGNVSFEKLVSDMVNLSWNFNAVTSLVDYYGFKDKGERSVEGLEKDLGQEIHRNNLGTKRVFPYVQRHEFEGLLFSDTFAFGAIEHVAEHEIAALSDIRRQFETPEDINDHPESAPSKRILNAVQGYRKRRDGLSVARAAGLTKIRLECPRFNGWLTSLEGLAPDSRAFGNT